MSNPERDIDEWCAEYLMLFGIEQLWAINFAEGEAEWFIRFAAWAGIETDVMVYLRCSQKLRGLMLERGHRPKEAAWYA